MAHVTLHAPPVDRRLALTVIVAEPAVPAWVTRWCRHADRQLRVLSTTDSLDRLQVIARLAGHSVLVPAPEESTRSKPGPVMAAVRDLPDDDSVLAEAAAAARELGVPVALTHVVPLSFAERSVHLDDAVRHGRWVLDCGVERLIATAPDVTVLPRLLRRRPHELVGEELEAELLVLGGPRPGFPVRVGSVASTAVQHAHCPVLLAPRSAWPGSDRTAIH